MENIIEQMKTMFVSGKFLRCEKKARGFKKGDHYWLEYIGNDTYVGRSDNILNKKFNIPGKEVFSIFSTP